MKKKFVSLLLALALCLTLVPAAAFADGGHSHPVCGATCSHTTGKHSSMSFATEIRQDADGTLYKGSEVWTLTDGHDQPNYYGLSTGTYYLSSDIKLDRFIELTGTDNVTLCLNGHSITTTGGSCQVIWTNHKTTFTLTNCKDDGIITHVDNGYGGGVLAAGTFNMYGGTISGNDSRSVNAGSGVIANGTFNMYGGAIINNQSTTRDNSASGVHVGGTFNLYEGTISGNRDTTKERNVYLPNGKTITIAGALTNTSPIGVTTANEPTAENPIKIATGAAVGTDYTGYFKPDVTGKGYEITQDNEGNLYLSVHQHSWTYTITDNAIFAVCKNCPVCSGTDYDGGKATITAKDSDYNGTAKKAEVSTYRYNWQGASVTTTYERKIGENTWESMDGYPVDAGTYKASITAGNATASVEYTIRKAAQTITVPTGKTIGKDGKPVDISDWASVKGVNNGSEPGALSYTLAAGYTGVSLADNKLTVTDEAENGDITINVTAAETDNYNTATASLTVKVDNRPHQIITTDENVKATYGETGKKINATSNGDGTISYVVKSGSEVLDVDATTGVLSFKKAGNAVVTVSVSETVNYTASSKDVSVVVNKAALAVTAKNQNIYVNGTVPDLTNPVKDTHYTITGLASGDTLTSVAMEYRKDNSAVTPDATKTGTYDIAITATADADKYEITSTPGTLTISTKSSGGGSKKHNTTTKVEDTKEEAKDEVKDEDKDETNGEAVTEFTDVSTDEYYADAVTWAAESGITGGVSTGKFAPNDGCTREQIVTFLWRAAGQPEPTATTNPFGDISEDSYYYKAVLWAIERGITNGTSDGVFAPDDTCTRAQAVSFIYRNEQANGGGFTDAWMFHLPFNDLKDWCLEAVAWCYKENITGGTDADKFFPDDTCTRAQIVTFLWRAAGEAQNK